MNKYICTICGYLYDEEKGNPEAGIVPGTTWEELSDDWLCPLCGATKAEFEKQIDKKASKDESSEVKKPIPKTKEPSDMKELSPLEVSAICSNLARGCEKQYLPEEERLFRELAQYFKEKSAPVKNPQLDDLIKLVEKDLEEGFPTANAAADVINDRGAKRALTWSEKVTKILKSLLMRYQREGDSMLENTGVYVCTICGFIYIGDYLPDVCPICKVPNWKFEKVEGGYAHV